MPQNIPNHGTVESMNAVITSRYFAPVTVSAAYNTGRPTFAYCYWCGETKHEIATESCACGSEAL